MKTLIVIPARMASTRFPGKPLVDILGLPMIEHVRRRVLLHPEVNSAIVATCDKEIFDMVKSYGGQSIMTSSDHFCCNDRVSEAAIDVDADIILNVQGDEPLIQPETIGKTIPYFQDQSIDIVNIMSCLETKEAFENENNVKVVVNNSNDALYFSREPIPSSWKGWKEIPRFMQTGIIAFRRGALINFNSMEETKLEKIESVDMNRILENGGKIRMILTEEITIGVDVPDDLVMAEKLLVNDHAMKGYL